MKKLSQLDAETVAHIEKVKARLKGEGLPKSWVNAGADMMRRLIEKEAAKDK